MAGTAQSTWWRAVLGEHPTGVTLITSRDAEGGDVGMVVGSFCAISQDPPLIGFFPDATSTTFPVVAANGRFVASVLGTAHEQLCRAFVRKDPDRFGLGSFVRTPCGLARPADAVAWFEAEIVGGDRYGDHDLVVGRVTEFGAGTADAGLPMLFRRGGYGSFAVPSEEFDADLLARRLRCTDDVSDVLVALAAEIGQEVVVSTVVGDTVMVLDSFAAGHDHARGRHTGGHFPFAAPMAPVFVAWADERRRSAWIEASRHLLGAVDRPGLAAVLDAVRRRGYGVSGDRALADRFTATQANPGRERFAAVWAETAAQVALTNPIEHLAPADISAVQVPVFGPDGDVELALVVNGFSELADSAAVRERVRAVRRAAETAGARIGGISPPASVIAGDGAPGAPEHVADVSGPDAVQRSVR